MTSYILIFFLINLLLYFIRNKIIKIYNLYDLPDNTRKIHLKKTSIVGGLFFLINIIFYLFLLFFNKNFLDYSLIFLNDLNIFYFFFIILSFFIFGYIDDKYNLNANLKLFILISLIFIILKLDNNLLISYLNFSFSDKILNLNEFNFIFTLFCFVAFINAFNLYDGINCQAGSYILFILLVLCLFYSDLVLLIAIIFPLILFLILNFSGKIFLGNSGSYLLGFMLAYIIIKTYNNGNYFYSDKILLIMFLPGIDMIRLFFTRLKNKNNPFSPDRKHLHHKLLQKFGYKYTIQIISVLSVMPYFLSFYINTYVILIFFIIFYFSLNKFLNLKKNT